ncbi:GNAT family N-acetyltransferase [Ilyomonas limi]|uniref:GNAT family N-acetyltransferase n=1 Tax=Ilyomonas limi TaxID=2575867 RepID=A0A4U3KQ11_9BACT|nr:GNAT family N-acetyltransferase [Ilyomonas limi]TKK64280.1 GNAT family N-acetyltransferase [Ilyomonas limi]
MITIVKSNAQHSHFVELVKQLDAELAIRDGAEHDFYNQFNSIGNIQYAIVAYDNNVPVGCGAIKAYNATIMEVKRMYTIPACRGKAVASTVLKALENWATEMEYEKCILETGKKQPEAIALYMKSGYQQIPNYGQYAGVANSVCFEKVLRVI